MDQPEPAVGRVKLAVKEINLKQLHEMAENNYRSRDFTCSESVVKAIRDGLGLMLPDDIIAMASGFSAGMGRAGCTCGAVVGGIMALGMIFGRTQGGDPKIKHVMALARELHDGFQKRHKVLCCRVLTKDLQLGSPEHVDQCVCFTGEVAEETARIIARELGIATLGDDE